MPAALIAYHVVNVAGMLSAVVLLAAVFVLLGRVRGLETRLQVLEVHARAREELAPRRDAWIHCARIAAIVWAITAVTTLVWQVTLWR